MESSKMHEVINNPGMRDFLGVNGTYWENLGYLGA
jgi:hypothetical protein